MTIKNNNNNLSILLIKIQTSNFQVQFDKNNDGTSHSNMDTGKILLFENQPTTTEDVHDKV